MSFSGEKVGYPTQKNEALVARIVRASSSPGDLVARLLRRLGHDGRRRRRSSDAGGSRATRARSPFTSLAGGSSALAGAKPFVLERDARAEADLAGRKLGATVALEGAQAALTLTSYSMPRHASLAPGPWSQQLLGWCVDWESTGDALRVGSSFWRNRQGELSCSATHRFERAGRYRVRVRAYDVLGGSATRVVPVHVSPK